MADKLPETTEPLASAPSAAQRPDAALPDHPWVRMRRMVKESIHNLPTPLVIILSLSIVAAVLTGVMLKVVAGPGGKKGADQYLLQRIEADASKPALDPQRIEGTWVNNENGNVMSLRLEKGFFEWVVKTEKNSTRYFARGSYKISGDVLILSQRTDLGQPKVEITQHVMFLPIAVTNLNVHAEENGKLMVWLAPSSERRRQDKDFLQLLSPDPDKPTTWVKVPGTN